MTSRRIAPALVGATAFLLSCASERGAPATALEVHLSGCDQMAIGPVCGFEDGGAPRTLRLWLPEPVAGEAEIAFNGVVIPALWRPDGAGEATRVELPSNEVGRLTVTARTEEIRREWSIEIAALAECPGIAEARELRAKGKAEDALALLDKGGLDSATGICAAERDGLAGRVLANDLDRTGDGVTRLESAFRERRASGDISGAIREAQTLAYLLTIKMHRFARVRELLAEATEIADGWAEGMATIDFASAQLALETGNLRHAVRRYEQAELWAGRLGLHRLRGGARQELADLLAFLGRPNEAIDRIESAVREDAEGLAPCARVNLMGNLGWIRFLALREDRDASAADLDRCVEPIREALALLDGRCANPFARSIALLNLAIIAAHRGRYDEAAGLLERSGEASGTPDEFTAVWAMDLRGRMAAERGDPGQALKIFEALSDRAAPGSRAALQGRTGRADALRLLGRSADAAAAYEEVERTLDAQLRSIPLDAGQGAFLSSRGDSSRHLVALYLADGRVSSALIAARRARGRILRELERDNLIENLASTELERWERGVERYRRLTEGLLEHRALHDEAAADEQPAIRAKIAEMERAADVALDDLYAGLLTAGASKLEERLVAKGVLVLQYFRLFEGWVAFASTDEGVTHAVLEDIDFDVSPEELSGALLAPFEREIDSASTLMLVVPDELAAVDFHALPWRGDALLARLPVVYSMDLAGGRGRVGNGRALVVADPSGDLAGARETGKIAAASLGSRDGGLVDHLFQTSADRERTLSAMEGASLFHFAGHARSGGPDGWSSCLVLAGDQRLSVGDILSLSDPPRGAILEACVSGATSGDAATATLGLGQSFVLAGSAFAAVTSRPLNDDTGALFSRKLYTGGTSPDPAEIRRALLELRRDCIECDWAAFRVIVP